MAIWYFEIRNRARFAVVTWSSACFWKKLLISGFYINYFLFLFISSELFYGLTYSTIPKVIKITGAILILSLYSNY